jgi:hypothetical protein
MYGKLLIEIRGLVFIGAIVATIWTFGGSVKATSISANLCHQEQLGKMAVQL